MPKRTDIKSILIIGAGPIVIGQACEFDYSGAQACKALRTDGYRIILVNSNPATIMTDPDIADATYIEPITPEIVTKIIEKERPDAILPTVGGQTALNCAMDLHRLGVLDKYKVTLIGASCEAIEKAENRQLFKDAMERIGLECPRNTVVQSFADAMKALEDIGLPAIIRPSFTLGGAGGGVAYNREEFEMIVKSGLEASPTHEIQIDESLIGWKEFEMEVVRDHADNCIIVCSIENVDPMGVHTGDSITVAPALTLTDKEYQRMRDASIAVLREIGVDTGGSNVQFAVNPEDGRLVVIEMNPRVSRSSALASKATGFPIAKVAAKLAVGYTLDEITNDCTKVTPASFEPVIDYVVTKIPRFTFEKFPGTNRELTSSMKSVGEAMAIGRNFAESFQKAMRSMETGLTGFDEIDIPGNGDITALKAVMAKTYPERLRYVAQAFRLGMSIDDIHHITHFDPWFLEQFKHIIDTENMVKQQGLPHDAPGFHALKKMGFSDARLAKLTGESVQEITARRHGLGVRPVYKRVDTCAAEFESQTPYMYSCYEGDGTHPAECEAGISARTKVIILGGGPNRIGQGIEFDYACVHAAYATRDAGFEAIMVNCNPETVSTDYDTSDRLYFEPLTAEDVIELAQLEQQRGTLKGVIVQFGGQTPLKLARALQDAGIPIMGTSPDAIHLAEDRERFQHLLQELNLKQPQNDIGYHAQDVLEKAVLIGYPLVVRPSYVLGGRAMEIIHSEEGLRRYLENASEYFEWGLLLLDRFLTNAIEVDVDALCDGKDVFVAGIMEHIEEAGIHSGDSACSIPPYSLSEDVIQEIKHQTKQLARALNVVGLMNIQFAVKGKDIYILEVNPRASRTVPFVAKSIGIPLAKLATRVMLGESLASMNIQEKKLNHVSVKEAVFPFARFPGVDVLLGPEMKSTGEAMGIDKTFGLAFAKAQFGSNNKLPSTGTVFISVKDSDKPASTEIARSFQELGFSIIATGGTADHLQHAGIQVTRVNKVMEGRPHIVDLMADGAVNLVINTSEGAQAIEDSMSIRRSALVNKISYTTTIPGAVAVAQAIKELGSRGQEAMSVKPLQEYY
ncbi:MAG: carbamoyl-phosphate synthase large subunit [Alphaproteobacteria bacterium]|nr:carbamoyl-phosphate synthase large subunit [Alphaproteobacteria bacterium]